MTRGLIAADEGKTQNEALTSATRLLNRLIKYRRTGHPSNSRVAEEQAVYNVADIEFEAISEETDPFAAD